jgi:formylmethanofuran dehydrogenase subunit B
MLRDANRAPNELKRVGTTENVACPFCGLGCDDLAIADNQGILAMVQNGCAKSIEMFSASRLGVDAEPKIRGEKVALKAAVERAASLLHQARLPIVGGLATDVAGARAALRLAGRLGGVVDHLNSEKALRNIRVLQDKGWMSTTLSEIRNRADLVIIVGGDVQRNFPRFIERCLAPDETLFAPILARQIVMLGGTPPLADGIPVTQFHCDLSHLAELAGALRCLIEGRALQAAAVAGIKIDELRVLAERMKQARYGVIVWSAADLDFPHAELAIEAVCDLVKALNAATRFAVLPLGGADGDITAAQVTTWQSGFPLRVAFSRGVPEYDPYHFSAARLLDSGQADALLWISAFDSRHRPPLSEIPAIVLGRAGMTFERPPEVYIPVGVPGLDHSGHVYRTDNVVALRLRKLMERGLHSVAEILADIESALDAKPGGS